MMNLKEKVGPFPAYVWGLILGIGIVGFVFLSNRNKGTTSKSANADSADPEAGLPTGWRDSSGLPVSSLGVVNTGTATTESNNSTWLSQGVKYGQSLGYTSLDVETALRTYLEGATLTSKQGAIVNGVISSIGLPPDGIGGIPQVQVDTPPAATIQQAPAVVAPAPSNVTEGALIKRPSSPDIFAVRSDHTLRRIPYDEWKSAGFPAYVTLADNNPQWSDRVVN